MHITLYRKYRPSSFSEVSGENEIVKSLKLSLKNKSMAHAYLFSGPRGVGKTTIARLIAKGVNCLNLGEDGEPCNECKNCKAINEGRFSDLIEIDAASNRSIDEIRSLKEKINYQPVEGLKKVYIIDEAHMLTKEAFNALLKTLEEPPSHVMFILATTELDKILPTIISRCQRYDFKALDIEDMKSGLKHILKEENLSMSDEVYPLIYENSSGSMRDSISILERLIVTANGNEINLKIAEDTLGVTPSSRIKIFLDKLLNESEYNIINELEALANESFDIELFFKDLAKYCKNAIVKNELDIDKGLKIISTIYDVINKFKFEDDKKTKKFELPLFGKFQGNNFLLSYEIAKRFGISDKDIQNGINHLKLFGRFEIFSKNPFVILDVAHNEDSMKVLFENLSFLYKKNEVIFITSMLKTKDFVPIFEKIQEFSDKIFITSLKDVTYGMSSCEIKKEIEKFEARRKIYLAILEDDEDALLAIMKNDKELLLDVINELSV